MAKYSFDTVVERKNTNSIKYDFNTERQMPPDVLPLWVADMDFETAPEIKEAILKRASHGIYGYTRPKPDYINTLEMWMKKHHGLFTRPEWYVYTPGVVFGLAMAVCGLTRPGDSVLIQRPVYYPFSNIITENNRNLINNPLIYDREKGTYRMDFSDFEEKIIENHVKLFILCNPHNPVGRVWKREELEAIGDICLKHGVKVVSDEIHEDFVYEDHKHIPFIKVKPEYEDITVMCTSPSKTFNLAGLQISNLIIPDRDIRTAIKREIGKTGYDEPNIMGITACQAAYTYGEEWLEELKDYLVGNLNFIREYLRDNLPKVKLVEPEGTYLIWLDFSAYGLTDKEINHKMLHEAKLWLDKGTMFGEEGECFQRVNIAAPRKIIEEAVSRIRKAFA